VNEKAISLIGDPFSKNEAAKLTHYLDDNFERNNVFIKKLAAGNNLNEHEIVILNTKGSVHETLISVRSITFNEKPTSVIGITNISELKKAQKELFHYASFDDMTGLLNRRAGLIFLDKTMKKIDLDNSALSICYVDLDGLKYVNDKYGHAEGDWLIQTVSQALNDIISVNDAGIRLGGDEFLLILHESSVEAVELLITKIENSLDTLRLDNNKPFLLSFSYGVTTYVANQNITADELISESDDLMYQSKQAKKNKAQQDSKEN
jgi:diguanylate cyclase (GGDEF)-like protein